MKIYNQNDFRIDTTPKAGMYFIGDDGNYYVVTHQHPFLLDEPCIKITNREMDDSEMHLHLKDFLCIRQLFEPEIKRLLETT